MCPELVNRCSTPEFHYLGATTEKALLPYVFNLDLGTTKNSENKNEVIVDYCCNIKVQIGIKIGANPVRHLYVLRVKF